MNLRGVDAENHQESESLAAKFQKQAMLLHFCARRQKFGNQIRETQTRETEKEVDVAADAAVEDGGEGEPYGEALFFHSGETRGAYTRHTYLSSLAGETRIMS